MQITWDSSPRSSVADVINMEAEADGTEGEEGLRVGLLGEDAEPETFDSRRPRRRKNMIVVYLQCCECPGEEYSRNICPECVLCSSVEFTGISLLFPVFVDPGGFGTCYLWLSVPLLRWHYQLEVVYSSHWVSCYLVVTVFPPIFPDFVTIAAILGTGILGK